MRSRLVRGPHRSSVLPALPLLTMSLSSSSSTSSTARSSPSLPSTHATPGLKHTSLKKLTSFMRPFFFSSIASSRTPLWPSVQWRQASMASSLTSLPVLIIAVPVFLQTSARGWKRCLTLPPGVYAPRLLAETTKSCSKYFPSHGWLLLNLESICRSFSSRVAFGRTWRLTSNLNRLMAPMQASHASSAPILLNSCSGVSSTPSAFFGYGTGSPPFSSGVLGGGGRSRPDAARRPPRATHTASPSRADRPGAMPPGSHSSDGGGPA
mmetsp:Transcript_92370/g.240699  ORF Transcript_92370/g.240699 Transcript_92370/m.240699 type:complete len:266 (+) Transcript_92370:205-1002(+)